jgi:hypothetical protein
MQTRDLTGGDRIPKLRQAIESSNTNDRKAGDCHAAASVPLAVLGIGVLFLLLYIMRSDETANSNLNVNV